MFLFKEDDCVTHFDCVSYFIPNLVLIYDYDINEKLKVDETSAWWISLVV